MTADTGTPAEQAAAANGAAFKHDLSVDEWIDRLTERGFHLFPVGDDKQPRTAAGFYNSSDNPAKVRAMLSDKRNAGLAAETGRRLGAFVLDCDNEEVTRDVIARGIPHTVQAKTRRGTHFYFKAPRGKDLVVRNRAGIIEKADIRGDGGFVVIAPFFERTWINSPLDTAFAEPPEWLMELLKPKAAPKPDPATKIAERVKFEGDRRGESREEKYCLAALDKEASDLAGVALGTRNDALNSAAYSLAGLAHYNFFSESDAKSALRDACMKNGSIPEEGEGKFDSTFASGWNAGAQSPREIPEGSFSNGAGRSEKDSAEQPPQSDMEQLEDRLAGLDDLAFQRAREKIAEETGLGLTELRKARERGDKRKRQREKAQTEQERKERTESAASAPEENNDGYVSLGFFKMSERGLWWRDPQGEASSVFCASPIRVISENRDRESKSWGIYLEINDRDGKRHLVPVPRASMIGDPATALRPLVDVGLSIGWTQRAEGLLMEYLNRVKTAERATVVPKVGWHQTSSGPVYVMPEETVGDSGKEKIILQSAHPLMARYGKAGTLGDWRTAIADNARGNSRLMLPICAAFGGTLLDMSGDESGGFNIEGASRTGKTTACKVGVSVWGPREHLQSWRATANGLEGVAAAHSDNTVFFDELGQLADREGGAVVYMLSNGRAKIRANKDGSAKAPLTWNLLFVSSGEIGISQKITDAGQKARAGHEARLVAIQADAGEGLGIFQDLHGCSTADAFANRLQDHAARYYGTAGPTFLELLTEDRRANPDAIASRIAKNRDDFFKRFVPADATGQVSSVASRFALLACAGRMAADWNIVGWPKEEVTKAIGECFVIWLENRGGNGDKEHSDGIAQVRAFIAQHGDARFQPETQPDRTDGSGNKIPNPKVVNRAGFRYGVGADAEYWIFPDVWANEVCKGIQPRRTARALAAAGFLIEGDGNHLQARRDIPDIGSRVRVYVVKASILSDHDPDAEAE